MKERKKKEWKKMGLFGVLVRIFIRLRDRDVSVPVVTSALPSSY